MSICEEVDFWNGSKAGDREFGEIRTDKELRNLQRIPDIKYGQGGGMIEV